MSTKLDDLIQELGECDKQERIDLLIDLAKRIRPLPEDLALHKDAHHRVEECQSPVYLFVRLEAGRVQINAEAPIESPTVRGFVSCLIEGLDGESPEVVLSTPSDLVERMKLTEILGMLRVRGLSGVLARLKREVTRAMITQSASAG